MIRLELFLCPESRAVGVEVQLFRLNAQLNIGLRLMLKLEYAVKPIFSTLVSFGPIAFVAWRDAKPS